MPSTQQRGLDWSSWISKNNTGCPGCVVLVFGFFYPGSCWCAAQSTTHYSKKNKKQPKAAKVKGCGFFFKKKKHIYANVGRSRGQNEESKEKWGSTEQTAAHQVFKLFLLSQRRPHLQCPAQSLYRIFPFVLFWQPQTAEQINPAVTHLNISPPENTVKGLLLGCRGALGCWSAICRRPRSRSPAAACSSTSRSRWPSGTACRGSRRGHSSLRETRAVRGQAFLFRWGVASS